VLVGNSWWSELHRANEDSRLCPPRVIVSISGEAPPAEGSVDWSGSTGKPFDVSDPPTGTTYIGRCVGKQLYISDTDGRQDDKRKKVEALVKVMAPSSSEDEEDKVIGTFVSRPIKVISKPSKKRQSAKNLEREVIMSSAWCQSLTDINLQFASTMVQRFPSSIVSGHRRCQPSIYAYQARALPSKAPMARRSWAWMLAREVLPLPSLPKRLAGVSGPAPVPCVLTLINARLDPFVLYIVDVNKAPGPESPPLAPPNSDYPSPPPNAIPFMNNGSPIPVYYNQTVVLQCLTSGVVSPILIIRKVDHQTTAVGGGAQEGAKIINDSCCPPGETWGDPVSQLAKIAFEVYDNRRVPTELGTPGLSGAFLSCMGEKVNTYRPVEGRQWTPRYTESPLQSPTVAHSPMSAGPSFASMGDYFGSPGMSSMPASPDMEYPTNDGGRVRKGKRSTSSAGPVPKAGSNKAPRRRPNSAGSVGGRQGSNGESIASPSSGAQWQVDIGETSVWTIVGVGKHCQHFLS
jgi:recombining binding protein (suppressor of hairless)